MLAAVLLAVATFSASPQPPVLLAAGDIASCASSGDEGTAALIVRLRGTVATLGDNAYDRGTAREFARCYAPSWGRFLRRTRPTAGNHDYYTPGAAGYFGYFGRRAGDPAAGYYSYELGSWHLIALNSNCEAVGGCGPGSPQESWLRADLAQHPAPCALAYWHHPRFSSGPHGSSEMTEALWEALYEAGAEIVLSGHDHLYERFAPQTPAGVLDRAHGIREFVVGTGGASHYPVTRLAPNSVVRDSTTFGVLRLTLHPARYAFRFVPERGKRFRDSGAARCH